MSDDATGLLVTIHQVADEDAKDFCIILSAELASMIDDIQKAKNEK